MKFAILAAVLLVGMTACQDRYRYPCQDPANQHKEECTPPECIADGTCTKFLIKQP